MRTILVLLCSFLLLHASGAHPFGDSVEVSNDISNDQVENPENMEEGSRDITVDATIQSSAHIEVPEAVAEAFIKAMVESFQNTKISGETTIQTVVSTPDDKAVIEERSRMVGTCLISRALCNRHCLSLGYRRGFCNSSLTCVCRN